jgi:ATP-dependent helicase/nuclease subunit A
MAGWTEDQHRAIYDRHHNLLVSAAAGAGKTAVLVERIIQLVLQDQVSIDRMLVVTFTQAAAAEMRDRISTALFANLQNEDQNQEYIRTQINLLSRATISTLHSFCLEVARRYFHLINIDPKFRVGDSTETELMKLEAMEKLIEQEYEKNSPLFLELVEMFGGGKDDLPLQNLIQRIYEFIQSQPEPLVWLQARAADFNLTEEAFERCPWVENIKGYIQIEITGVIEILNEAREIAMLPGGPQAYVKAIDQDLLLINELLHLLALGINEFYARLPIQHLNLARADRDADPVLVERVKKMRQQGKDALKSIQKQMFFQTPLEFCQDLQQMQPTVDYLYFLVKAFAGEYQSIKAGKGIVDFNDLEHYALAILSNSQAADDYRHLYKYIFVDEYQDSNLVQEALLSLITRPNNLFMVGDVKQSIYRFRLADPELFMHKYETFKTDGQAVDQRLELTRNFRSRPEIIAGINDIFSRIMSRQFSEISYDDKAELRAGLEIPPQEKPGETEPSLEMLLINKKQPTHINVEEIDQPAEEEICAVTEEDLEPLGDVEAEARLAAQRINQLVGQTFYDIKLPGYRPLEYRDMVVLMRAARQQTEIYLEAFSQAGIPVYTDVDRGYFETLEISIFVNLLRLIDNKRQDLPLLSVLRSPIGRFSLEDLIQVRAESQALSYFEAVEEYMGNHRDDLQIRLQWFIDRLDEWKEAARYTPMDELIWRILLETGYYYYVGAMPGGRQRQANLKILLDRAEQYQASSFKGLFHFLKFVEKIETSRGDVGMAKILGENENVVRIMSIHKSKGLEFPVVIMAGMGRKFNLRDTMEPVLLHKELGLGPCLIDHELRVSRDSWARVAIKNRIRRENLAEEIRILYVACTRARDRLIMIGSVNDLSAKIENWSRAIDPFQLARGRSHLDWIGPVVFRHPDGKILRQLRDLPLKSELLTDHDYHWKINIFDHNQIRSDLLGEQLNLAFKTCLDASEGHDASSARETIWSRFDWHYDFADAAMIPSKITVSQVKDLQTLGLRSLEISSIPNARQPRIASQNAAREISGAVRGTIFHLVMQHLDFKHLGGEEEIRSQIDAMVEKEFLRPEEAQTVAIPPILQFFSSQLGQRILSSRQVHREVPFNLRYPAGAIFADLNNSQEELLLQGIIDLYFVDEDELVLVDYKTDRVTPMNRHQLIDIYQVQVQLYKTALERILGQKVKECFLYFFDSGEAVTMSTK